jgi:signal transduction histidine kinase
VFVLDRPHWEDEDLTLTEIVASRLRLELEYYALSIELKETAASRERIRLARDLHDGVLQTLTGAALQLSSLVSYSGQELKQKFSGIRELLLAEQQRIRAFVEGRELSLQHQHASLIDQIKKEIESIERRWGCQCCYRSRRRMQCCRWSSLPKLNYFSLRLRLMRSSTAKPLALG